MNNQWRDHAERTVIWSDGTYDTQRECSLCNLKNCQTPVHKERYQTFGQARIEVMEDTDPETAKGYWSWMHENKPLGGDYDFDGDLVTPEFNTANPDNLAEAEERHSGITEEQHTYIQEALKLLTTTQRDVWNAVMREQVPQAELARRLGVSEAAISKSLKTAKVKVTNYLRSKQDNATS